MPQKPGTNQVKDHWKNNKYIILTDFGSINKVLNKVDFGKLA